MPGPLTVVTFTDADGDEFPITLIGTYKSMADAISDANGILTKAIIDGNINPTKPITLAPGTSPYEWGAQSD